MPKQERIPTALATLVGELLGSHYFNHRAIDLLFQEAGAPEEVPDGSCAQKSTTWLKRASADPKVDALKVLGKVLAHYMESANPRYPATSEEIEVDRQRIRDCLARFGMSYRKGGVVLGGGSGPSSRALEEVLRDRDLGGVEVEFSRALGLLLVDPAAAVTAACAIVEAICKVYIQDENLPLPSEQSLKPLWKVVQGDLGLDPAQVADDDLKRILSGLTSVLDGLGALRTHAGSAHGRGRRPYSLETRHARLAVHSAHSLALFAIESWESRKSKKLHP